jgi:hypothetical protein
VGNWPALGSEVQPGTALQDGGMLLDVLFLTLYERCIAVYMYYLAASVHGSVKQPIVRFDASIDACRRLLARIRLAGLASVGVPIPAVVRT